MCKHVLNSKVYFQAACCSKWFECSECHDEAIKSHKFEFASTMRLTCKTCRKCFNRDFTLFSEMDKFCSYCKEQWVLPGITPESKVIEEISYILENNFYDILNPQQEFYTNINVSDIKY